MTQNLRIYNKSISNEDSDISNGNFFVPDTTPISNMTSMKNNNANLLHYYNYEIGCYYTYYASVAGNYVSSGDSFNSICPKQWKLPNKDDVVSLGNKYNIESIGQPPASFTKSGSIVNGALVEFNSYHNYRTASVNNSESSYYLHSNISNFLYNGKTGHCQTGACPMRCISRN